MIKFDGTTSYLVPPKNRYQLSNYEPYNITEDDFTFVSKVKVDWDKMNAFDKTREGGLLSKNGKHIGLSVLKNTDDKIYIRGQFWCKLDDGSDTFFDLFIEVDPEIKNKILDVAFVHNKSEKIIFLLLNDKIHEIKYEGDIIDYSDSWIWIGCQNAFDSCDEMHRGFYFGEIYYSAIFGSALNIDEINKSFLYKVKEDIDFKLKPVCVFNYEEKTSYKVYDITENGNNMIMFDKRWMSQI